MGPGCGPNWGSAAPSLLSEGHALSSVRASSRSLPMARSEHDWWLILAPCHGSCQRVRKKPCARDAPSFGQSHRPVSVTDRLILFFRENDAHGTELSASRRGVP